MKILYTNFHVGSGGGQDTYIRDLAVAMSRSHQVTVASPPGSHLATKFKDAPGVETVEIHFKLRWRMWLRETLKLRKLIEAGQFDIIHVNGSADHRQVMLALVGLRNRPEVVFTKHNTYGAHSLGNWFRAKFATRLTIAVSDHVREMLERKSPYKNVVVIKHGVRAVGHEALNWDEIRTRRTAWLGVDSSDAIILGSAAGTGESKGWADLVAALMLLPVDLRSRFRIWLAGTDPSAAQRAMVSRCGLDEQIVFTGSLDSVQDLLAVTDVSFVLSYYESLSYACREAMAMGCPMLVTNVGGLPENVSNGVDGWIVPPRNAGAIAQVLRDIVADPGRVRLMGHMAAMKARSEFCFESFVAATQGVYMDALSVQLIASKQLA
ncbi:glycosyl transferase family 1 [Pandoraea iniqua]|uniref:glycosyltransferase family 4 protein n=1 Tax=Pandoraea iniqua TaxID=2508288 RepID=UPI001240BCF0|nr:glycosyltransferase family 4 protein [Pandoraea iniqua]VVD73541.1 glycosyl transferase family 1 [Pandoraea iniqua]